MKLRLATRGSPLARWQAERVATLLAEVGVESELILVVTEGDRRTDVPLAALGGQGIFVKEVQAALLEGVADVAVHSAKDLPASAELAPPGLVLAAVPERGDARDVLVGSRLEELAPGATVATGSARRRVQLAYLRPDLRFVDLRGNLARRLAAVGQDEVAAVITARAALDRLGWEPPAGVLVETIPESVMVPQVGQGALALECRADDRSTREALTAIDDPFAHLALNAERGFLAALGGGCTLPVGAHARWILSGQINGPVELVGMVAAHDASRILRTSLTGPADPLLGAAVAEQLMERDGGRSLLGWSEWRAPGARP